ncbi:Mu transposase C-terminal domain-containing protein [Marinimicrobium sp. C2-29]|uniref:Mu transposase C-terminal domain-containing protein n=1 Tax=Marinimicrobium sp. C2-29 TaxID=3139825 RepID=UPI00313882BB
MNTELTTGNKIKFSSGEEMTICNVHLTAKQIELQSINGKKSIWDLGELQSQWSDNKISLIGDCVEKRPKYQPQCYPQDLISIAERNLIWVRAATDENGRWIKNKEERLSRIEQAAQLIETEATIPSDRNLRRYAARYRRSNQNLESLVPKIHRRGNRKPKLAKPVNDLIDQLSESFYLRDKSATTRAFQNLVNYYIANTLELREYPFVSYTTISERVNSLSEYQKTLKREGFLAARRDFPAGMLFERPSDILLSVEIDHTPMDVEIVSDDRTQSLGRPYLTAVMDRCTGVQQGHFMMVGEPNSYTTTSAIVNAIDTKNAILEKHNLNNDCEWPSFGIMREIVMDNGSDLISNHTRSALLSMNISCVYNPKGHPQRKGKVERFFRTMNESFCASLPGHTSRNYQKKGDYKSSKKAVLTLDELERLYLIWLLNTYHKSIQAGREKPPLELWKEREALGAPISLPASKEELIRIRWENKDLKVQKFGVTWDCAKYQSPELQRYAKQHGMSATITIYRDPADISSVYFYDSVEKQYVDVPASDRLLREQRLTRDQFNEIRTKARKDRRDRGYYGNVKPEDLHKTMKAQIEMVEKATEDTRKSKRLANAKKSAKHNSRYGKSGSLKTSPMGTDPGKSLFSDDEEV